MRQFTSFLITFLFVCSFANATNFQGGKKVTVTENQHKDQYLAGEKINIKKEFKSAIIVHKKKTTFYTINAMNKAIEVDNDLEGDNIDYYKYKMNWKKYHNQIILVSDNNLALIDIKRFFL